MSKGKVLLVNKFYYNRGGDCVVMLTTERLLREAGYDVAVYAMQYSENFSSQYDTYFATEVSFSGGAKAKVDGMKRVLGKGDVQSSFARLLKDFEPDVVHFHNIHSYLSPVLVEMAHAAGARTVWTMHDYKLLCPSYSCLRDGKVCELCLKDKKAVLRTRCMKGSLAASAIAYLEAAKWNRERLEACTDAFICPSQFMQSKMVQGGFTKTHVICNCVDDDKVRRFEASDDDSLRSDYCCYVGRLSEEKGVRDLLSVVSQMPALNLKVAGDGPLAEELRNKYITCRNIEFLGRLDADEVASLLLKARASVINSQWYENNPLGVIESLCAGTPVVGAKIGGIPELITHGETGLVFDAFDNSALKQALTEMMTMDVDNALIAEKSSARFSAERYLAELLRVYEI